MRPRYGDHIEHDRTIEVFFYTSNIQKLIQARLVFARFGYTLRHFRGPQEPYNESYDLGTQELLRRAVKQVTLSFGVKSIFFVEDTSICIDALSETSDFRLSSESGGTQHSHSRMMAALALMRGRDAGEGIHAGAGPDAAVGG